MPARRPSRLPLWLASLGLLCLADVSAADRLNVGFFQEWPTRNLAAKARGDYESALQVPVRWIAFDTGTQMSVAFEDGQIDIAYSQGLAPFVTAVNAGVPITAVGAAVGYPADDCVVREGSGIDAAAPRTLAGRKVAIPFATAADFSFRLMLRALDVDAGSMTLLDRIPSDAAVLLVDGEVDMACGFGALAMAKMYTAGEPLLDEARKLRFGISSVDLITVRDAFLAEEAELVRRFLAVTERANVSWQGSPEELRQVGLESGLDVTAVLSQLRKFDFPDAVEQRGELLGLDGTVPESMRVAGEVFATGDAPALPDYSRTIDTRFLP